MVGIDRLYAGQQRVSRLVLSLLALALWLLSPLHPPLDAQNYMTAQYDKVPTDPVATNSGYVERANGTLHLEIVLGSFPQRASSKPLQAKLVYDTSQLWYINSGYWEAGSGRFDIVSPGPMSYVNSVIGTCNVNYYWIDGSYSTHYFPLKICPGGSPTSGDAFATDSSGYHLYINVVGAPVNSVYGPDGSLLVSETGLSTGSPHGEDSNGNYFSAVGSYLGGGLDDTTGREIVSSITLGSVETISIPNSQGTTSSYTVTNATIAVKTHFHQSGVNEFSGNMGVVQSIALPDGTSYTFKYDCDSSTNAAVCSSPTGQAAYYGGLTSVTLPTGGQDTYAYTTFKDARGNEDLWLHSRTSDGGTWTYTPSLANLGSSICGSSQCQQVQVTKPNGDTTVTDYRIDWINSNDNGGTFPVLTNYYTGGVSSSNLLQTITDTYDFSISCPLVSCSGHAYIRKIQELVTMPVPGGTSITKQTKWTYDSPQQGNITGDQEWGYRAGTSPTFPSTPDRATYKTYLTTGSNNINRPTSITTCNGSGSSSYCPGGGTVVSQRIITYDSGVLVSVAGVSNHDDTNFGLSFTTRGNPTQIKDFVSGTSYLTSGISYDTTGNVIKTTDPVGNATTYSYTDNYFNDVGSTPQAFTPPKPTNAYATSITLPATGSFRLGYYYGTGKDAVNTDQNGANTYTHFADPLDRPTAILYPVAWNLLTYPSATEVDTYIGVADTSPSAGCSSCEHDQLTVDGWGRKIADKLTNNPSGAVITNTAYDLNGRTQQTSHPYINPSTPQYESVAYDGLDRSTQDTHPDSSVTATSYGAAVSLNGGVSSQLCSNSTYGYGYPNLLVDESGKKRQVWLDGFGNTIEADEPDASGNLTVGTCYTYSAIDRLTTVVQGSETRTFTYDGLGRTIQETTPEVGTVTFSYTNSGALCSGNPSDLCAKTEGAQNQTNPSTTVTTTYCYNDPLGRITSKGYGPSIQSCPLSSPSVTYAYDQGGAGNFALGRMTNRVDPSGSETYAYDSAGRITRLQKVIGGTNYSLGYSYNVADEVTLITYPSGRQVQLSHDVVGHLLGVASGTTTYLSVPTTNGYNAANQPLAYNYGNGVTATFGYSPTRSQLVSLSYANSSGTLFAQNYFYSYDQNNCPGGTAKDNGQINCIADTLQPGRTASYIYDPLRRLSSAVTTGSATYPQWGISETYDRYGNRLTQSVTAGSGPSFSGAFTTSNRPSGYTYDASGNLAVEPLSPPNDYSYDAENRMIAFSGSGGNASYAYDDSSLRVKKVIQGGTTSAYIFSGQEVIAEYDNGAVPASPSREYIYGFAGSSSTLIAKIENGATQYYHQDHLSNRLITDGTMGSPTFGQTIGQQGHFPFGESWYSSGTNTKWAFTSYEKDQDTGNNSGLNYAMARFYNSRTASFCSADPVGGRAEDPQSWNRYAYGRDDPINVNDPSGKFWELLFLLLQVILSAIGQVISQLGAAIVSVGATAIPSCPPAICVTTTLFSPLDTAVSAALVSGAAAAGAAGSGASMQDILNANNKLQSQSFDKKNCQNDLARLGTTAEKVREGAANASITNSTTSDLPYSDLYEHTGAYSAAQAQFQDFTIGGGLGRPGVWAVSSLNGSNIYVNPGRWVGGLRSNMATLMHEVLHNITGKSDDALQRALKLKVQDASSNISKKLEKDCIK